jgi:hypothetical protein
MTQSSGPGDDLGGRRDTGDEFQARMEAFGREAQAAGERFGRQAQVAGERFGREAQAAGERLARDPGVIAVGTWFTRFIGLIVIVVGAWLFAEFNLGWDLPALDWNLIWPAALVLLGGLAIASAMTRRR